MAFPLMFGSLIILPKSVSYIVLIGLVVAGILEFRQSFIGRVGIFLNSMLLWQLFYSSFNSLPNWFQWYLNIGTIAGIIALVAYIIGQSLPSEFYQICFIAYGSISVLIAVGLYFGFFNQSTTSGLTVPK